MLHDALMYDGLEDARNHETMGLDTEHYLPQFPAVTRERQDAFAAASHERAARATKDGFLAAEITPVEVPQRQGDPLIVETDEGIRPGTTSESLGRLRPAFSRDGIHHGRQRLADLRRRRRRWWSCRRRPPTATACNRSGRVVSYGMVAGPDTCLMTQPSRSTVKALERAGLSVGDVDVFEFNEAFAAVALAFDRRAGPARSTSSTPTAAPSPWATRSARPATGWRSPCCTSCAAAAGASAWPPCAAAAARATPWCAVG